MTHRREAQIKDIKKKKNDSYTQAMTHVYHKTCVRVTPTHKT